MPEQEIVFEVVEEVIEVVVEEVVVMFPPSTIAERGEPGRGVPVGGTAGQVLAKRSGANFDGEWVDLALPPAVDAYLGGEPDSVYDSADLLGGVPETATIDIIRGGFPLRDGNHNYLYGGTP